jgi:drug/metabolite transporter (DMT)-like permease
MLALLSSPVLLATLSAFLFGASVLSSKRGLLHVDPQTGSMISICTTVVIYGCLAPFLVRAEYWSSPAIWIFMANGLIHPLVSMTMSFEATRRMGAMVSSTVSSASPWFSTLGALALLGERLTASNLLGTLATVIGIMILTYDPGGTRTWARSDLLFALLAAAVRGSNNLMGKFGLDILPVPFMAAWLSFSVSGLGSVLIYRLRTGALPRSLPRGGLRWFSLTGAGISMAILCMYAALAGGQVVVIAPITAAYPVFTLLLSLLLRQEVLSGKIVLGTLVAVAGVVLISLK